MVISGAIWVHIGEANTAPASDTEISCQTIRHIIREMRDQTLLFFILIHFMAAPPLIARSYGIGRADDGGVRMILQQGSRKTG